MEKYFSNIFRFPEKIIIMSKRIQKIAFLLQKMGNRKKKIKTLIFVQQNIEKDHKHCRPKGP